MAADTARASSGPCSSSAPRSPPPATSRPRRGCADGVTAGRSTGTPCSPRAAPPGRRGGRNPAGRALHRAHDPPPRVRHGRSARAGRSPPGHPRPAHPAGRAPAAGAAGGAGLPPRGPAAVPTDGGGTGRGRSLAAVPHAPALPLRRPAPARRGRAPPRPGLRTAPRLRRLLPRTGPPPVEPRLAGRRPARRRGGPRRTRQDALRLSPARHRLRDGRPAARRPVDVLRRRSRRARARLAPGRRLVRADRPRPAPGRPAGDGLPRRERAPGRRPDRPCRGPTGCAGLFRSFPATRLP